MVLGVAERTNVYVDAFNLYYRCLKGTPYKWLDLRKLCELLLPSNVIHEIKYFTAIARPDSSDPQQQQRQQAYLRALLTLPGVSIQFGHYMRHPVRMPRVDPPHRTVAVWKTEEKGSDVNLATAMLVDAFNRACEVAVVISNDSDLKAPIEAVQNERGMNVGVVIPGPRSQIQRSALPATFYRRTREGVLKASQFPSTLMDANGTITKPSGW